MAGRVTDPALLAELEGDAAPTGRVEDPELLAQLEGGSTPAAPSTDEAVTLAGLQKLRNEMPDENPMKLLSRYKQGERGRFDRQLAKPSITDDDLLSAIRGTYGPDRAEAFSRGVVKDVSLGLADEAAGIGGGAVDYLKGKGDWDTVSRANRDEYRANDARAQAAHPGEFSAGEWTGTGISMLVPGGAAAKAAKGAKEARLLVRAGKGALTGGTLAGAQGGVKAYGEYEGEDQAGKLQSFERGAVESAPWGAALGGALPIAGATYKKGRELYRGAKEWLAPQFKPTAEAEQLQKMGVELTTGQLDPRSAVGQVEEVATSSPVGSKFTEPREKAEGQFRDLIIKELAPDGSKVPTGGKMKDKLKAVYDSFTPAYAEIKEIPIYPAIHNKGAGVPLQSNSKTRGAIDLALDNDEFPINEDLRENVRGWVHKQMKGIIPGGAARPNMVNALDSANVLKVRENIRKAKRAKLTQGRHDEVHLLGKAEEAITDALQSQLPEDKFARLNELDKKYAMLATIEEAAGRSGSTGEFSAKQLSATVRAGLEERAYGRGEGGRLRELADTGEAVFNPRVPKTGVQYLAQLPGGRFANPAVAAWANTPAGRARLLKRSLKAPDAGPDPLSLGGEIRDLVAPSKTTPRLVPRLTRPELPMAAENERPPMKRALARRNE